jgi:neutral amino acid transport system ATP-binding protein
MLEAHDIHHSFGGVKAVDGVSFSVPPGRIVGLIGTNGAGKTTLFNVVSGYLRAGSGRVTHNGEDIQGEPPHRIARRGIVRTFQTPTGFPRMTVLENMLVFARGQEPSVVRALTRRREAGAISPDLSDRAQDILALFGLAGKRDVWVQDLGAPELKMLEFARTTMAKPLYLLLDEPAAGVNVALLDKLTEAIFRLRDEGVTFLIVDHNLGFICRVCDFIYAMADGRVICEGDPDQVVNDPGVIDCYIGSASGDR